MNNPLVSPGLGVIVWMVIAFAILAFILMKWGWPVILKALDEREKTINESLNAAEQVRAEMAQLKAHNEDLLKEAKLERDEMLRHARLTSEQIIEEARQKATIEADRIVLRTTVRWGQAGIGFAVPFREAVFEIVDGIPLPNDGGER